jgi:cellulose synthase/poly-beta-1,6-N-acetylglucosamine synthase-like glycosyltransferase
VGICAVTEVENTIQLVSQILTTHDPNLPLGQLIVATPNPVLARKLDFPDHRLIIIQEKKREGKISALRKILKQATGDILVFASADIKLGVHSLGNLVNALTSHETWGAVDSHVEVINEETHLMDRISILLWEVHNETLDQLDGNGRLAHLAGDLWAVRREMIEEIPDTINDDAYLALMIQRNGRAIHRVGNSLVWIAGPSSPADYVAQRSRILLGHFHLIRDFRAVPTTFEFTLPLTPRRNLKTLVAIIRKLGPSYLTYLFVAAFLELVSFQVAMLSLVTRRKPRAWRIAHSTKVLRSLI